MLPRGDIAAGDVVLGLASSGVHSNGYSLVRKVVAKSKLKWSAPAPFDKQRKLGAAVLDADPHLCEVVPRGDPRNQARARRWRTSPAADFPTTFRACCRRTSARASISRACRCCRCSNGWPRAGGIAEKEMLRTFNCGIGMIAVVEPRAAGKVADVLEREGEARRAARRGVAAAKGKPHGLLDQPTRRRAGAEARP